MCVKKKLHYKNTESHHVGLVSSPIVLTPSTEVREGAHIIPHKMVLLAIAHVAHFINHH